MDGFEPPESDISSPASTLPASILRRIPHPKALSELARPERDPKTGKLDHQLDGSKDVADGRRDSSAVRACLRPGWVPGVAIFRRCPTRGHEPLIVELRGSERTTATEEKPVDGNTLLQRQRDQEVGVWRLATLIAVYILLEDAEVPGEGAL